MAGFFHQRAAWSLPALLILLCGPLSAAEPEIRNLSVRGLQIDGSTALTVDGDGFGTSPRLLLPFPVKSTLKAGATDKQATFDVILGNDVTPGYYQLRLVNDNRVSLPVVIAVDRLVQRPFIAALEQLPVALYGTIGGASIVETTFKGAAGQKIMIEVESQRLGAKLRPVIHLYGPKNLQISWAWGKPILGGDARLETTLPADGTYRITMHDSEYQATAPAFFRLRIGQWSYIDQVFPKVIGKDMSSVELLGSQADRASIAAIHDARWLPLPWPKAGLWSGPQPFVETSQRTELLELPPSAKPQELPAGPVAVSGKLSAPFEEDRYRIPVTPGTKIRLEVFAERLGSPLDAALVVRNEAGAELARAEDSPGTLDPVLEYAVPPKVDAILVGVVDSQGQGGPRGCYRLTIDQVTPAANRNDFALFTPDRRIVAIADGRTVFPVWVERRGYKGPIELKPTGMPADVKLEGLSVPEGADGTLITMLGGSKPVNPAIVSWKGRAADGREQPVQQKNHPMEKLQPWMATEFGLGGSSANGKEFRVDWKQTKPDDSIILGRRWPLTVAWERTGTPGPVRLTMLTSQPPVLINNNQPDPNRMIRLEKPIEAAATVKESEITLLTPVELPGERYDISIAAELLSADKKTVLATAVTPVRRLPVRVPIELKLEGPNRIEVKADPKKASTFEIAGEIQRLEGVAGDVQIALAGLPGGAKADPLTMKADAKPFKLKVTLPAGIAAGEIKGLKLSGSIVVDPKLPNQRVRSRELEITLNIQTMK